MDVVIYESSAGGGCYNYSKYLFEYYQQSERFGKTELIVPKGSDARGGKGILLRDFGGRKKYFRRTYFILRNILNPIILFFYLLTKRRSFVLFNDFEQYSFFIWVPFFYLLKWKHSYGIFLHDPDRDAYMPTVGLSRISMSWITGLMDFLLYHEYLPQKSYYQKHNRKFLSVPHGVYQNSGEDNSMTNELERMLAGKKTLSIIGNIRADKNYEFAIRGMSRLEHCNLLIAGSPANTRVDVEGLKRLSDGLGVSRRVIWIERYFSDAELASIIKASDIILLVYNKDFVSHSGVLNLIASYRKKVIISQHPSGLSEVVKKFSLGKVVRDNDLDDFSEKVGQLFQEEVPAENWNAYIDYASWEKQVDLVADKVIK